MNNPSDNFTDNEISSLHAAIHGRVQGVGFRIYALSEARRLGLTGSVQNRPDGSVYVVAHGPRPALERLLSTLRSGPPGARVERVAIEWSQPPSGESLPARFEVLS